MKKQEIIEASILLFESRGFSETSIQDIVESLGVTKGTFYYYFTSKEKLLMEIHQKYIGNLLNRQQEIMNSSDTQKTKVVETIRLLTSDIRLSGRRARVFYQELRNLSAENQQIIKQKRKMFRMNLQKILEKGIKDKEFRQDLNAEMVCFAILGMCNWSYNWYDPEGSVTDIELADIYARTLMEGISEDPAGN